MNGPVKRTASVLLAGTIGALGPGIAPPAMADQEDWRPPEADASMLPDDDDGTLPEDKDNTTECIEANDDRDNGKIVKAIPWGWTYLQLDEVHEIMADTTGGIGLDEDGDPMTVAVIDTGVNERRWLTVHEGADYVAEDGPGLGLNDCDGHGTMVAGIIAADIPDDATKVPESIGFQGVAPDAEIMSVRQSSDNYSDPEDDDKDSEDDSDDEDSDDEDFDDADKDSADKDSDDKDSGDSDADNESEPNGTTPEQHEPGKGDDGDDEEGVGNLGTLAQAVRFAASQDDVDVMNISIDNCRKINETQGKQMQQLHAAVDWAANKQDVVIVASAGNVGPDCAQNTKKEPRTIVAPPWFDDDVLAVGAITEEGGVADFSMHGPWVDVVAPGTDILSLDPAPSGKGLANRVIQDGEAEPVRGTSYAAPYVSGLATLIRAKYPDWDAHQVMERIENTAQHPAAPDGHSQYIGRGVINPVAALTTSGAATTAEQGEIGPVRAELPDPVSRDWTPIIVAFSGAGGALVALLITLFTVHTIRRNRPDS